MDPRCEIKKTARPELKSGRNPINLTASTYLTHPRSSRKTEEPEGNLHFPRQSTQNSDRTTTGPSSSQFLAQDSLPAPSQRNSRSGFFAGASHVDASYGVFNDVGRDQYIIKVDMKGNDIFPLNKLPRAKNAGHLAEHHRKCLPGTRKTELERIEKWEVDHTDKRVYWLNGVTGSGKSSIAQTVAARSSAQGRLGASFFCSRDFLDRRNIRLIFPTLAFCLAHRYRKFRKALIKIMSSNPDVAEESLAIQLENLIVRPLQSTKLSTTIVIDALDECEDSEPASAILSLLARHIDAIPFVKFFITGRPELPIRSGFRLPLLQPHTEVFVLHDVDPSSVNQDIELYLRTRISELIAERSHWDLTVPWPTDDDIAALVKKSSGLFIVAFIIIRLIGDRRLEPKEQLKVITSEANSTTHEGRSGIDNIYQEVFLRSFEGIDVLDTNFFGLLRLVVGSIVSVFNPLSCADLAKILDIPRERVWNAIRLLHSVLMVPDSDTWPLRICHKSFADFLTDPSRCTDKKFYVEPSVSHMTLATCCLRLMNASLRTNICDLPPYAMNKDIDDLDARREKHIGSGLEYACRSWANHLRFTDKDGGNVGHVIELLECFFKHYLLAWLEVLSIMGDMRCAVYSLRDVRDWFVNAGSPDTNLLNIMKDSERYVLRFFDAIEVSACHIYYSTLPWCPESSLIRALYQDKISTEVKMMNAIDDSWDASMRTIQARDTVWHITFSHTDDLVAIGEEGCVEVFETLTGHRRAIFTLTETALYRTVAFSPDNALLATGRYDGILDLWDLQTGGLVSSLKGHARGIHSIAFSPCGTKAASCSLDDTVRIWDVSSRHCQYILRDQKSSIWSFCWSATRNEIISGHRDGTVKMWDIIEMRCVKTLSGHANYRVSSVACSPDSSLIASGSFREVSVFNVQTGHVSRTISTDDWVESIRFLDQNSVMYATQQATFVIQGLTEMADMPTTASKNWLKRSFQKARIGLELFQNRRRHSKAIPTKNANVLIFKYQGSRTAISSDGTCIASGDGNVVKIWQTNGPSPNYDTDSHYGYVYSVAFSGDGRLTASGSADNTVKLWNPTTGQCLNTFSHPDHVTSVVFSPDSKLLASGAFDDVIHIWDTRTHKLTSTLGPPSHVDTFHYGQGFSANNNRLVSLEQSNYWKDNPQMHLELWDIATRKCLISVEVDASFRKASFSVDGTSVILESKDSRTGWRVSPNRSAIEDHKNNHPSHLMEFFPIPDAQQSVSPRLYHYRQENEWILDKKERRVLWVPPDLRHESDSYGNMVALGSQSGRVPILDFSDVRY